MGGGAWGGGGAVRGPVAEYRKGGMGGEGIIQCRYTQVSVRTVRFDYVCGQRIIDVLRGCHVRPTCRGVAKPTQYVGAVNHRKGGNPSWAKPPVLTW